MHDSAVGSTCDLPAMSTMHFLLSLRGFMISLKSENCFAAVALHVHITILTPPPEGHHLATSPTNQAMGKVIAPDSQ
jgi:hypothetical protein